MNRSKKYIENKVIEFTKVVALTEYSINKETIFFDDLGFDLHDILKVTMLCEEEFLVKFSSYFLLKLISMEQLINEIYTQTNIKEYLLLSRN